MAEIQVTAYDPKKVNLNVLGHNVTGFGDGDKIVVEPVTKTEWESDVGVDGDVVFSRNHDKRYNIKVKLHKSSPTNIFFQQLRKVGVPFPVYLENKAGGKYIGGGLEAFLSERPSTSFGTKLGAREWVIQVASYSEEDLG